MPKISYMGNDSTVEFTFNFPYFENTDILVTKNNEIATGYSIIGNPAGLNADIPYTGGKVVFDIAPTTLDNITIKRKLPLTRTIDYQPTAKINPTILNQDMNYTLEVLKDFQEDIDIFQTNYEEITNKTSTTTLLNQIDYIKQLVNHGEIMKKSIFFSYMNNCITEIPQDIKLELSSGTLILKSDSKLHLANGNLEDTNITTSDISATQSNGGRYLVIQNTTSSLYMAKTRSCLSGTIANRPNTLQDNAGLYFATDENKIYLTGDAGNTWYSGQNYTLPICIITVSNGAISSIDQVFNGFGYIGSTVFALPGVKILESNGRNTDGTLKNTDITIQNVIIKTIPTNLGWHYLTINSTGTACIPL